MNAPSDTASSNFTLLPSFNGCSFEYKWISSKGTHWSASHCQRQKTNKLMLSSIPYVACQTNQGDNSATPRKNNPMADCCETARKRWGRTKVPLHSSFRAHGGPIHQDGIVITVSCEPLFRITMFCCANMAPEKAMPYTRVRSVPSCENTRDTVCCWGLFANFVNSTIIVWHRVNDRQATRNDGKGKVSDHRSFFFITWVLWVGARYLFSGASERTLAGTQQWGAPQERDCSLTGRGMSVSFFAYPVIFCIFR